MKNIYLLIFILIFLYFICNGYIENFSVGGQSNGQDNEQDNDNKISISSNLTLSYIDKCECMKIWKKCSELLMVVN